MNKTKLLSGLKIIIILLLLMAISVLAILKWKSDLIIDKVMATVQRQLTDSLQYTDATLNWFSYFPSAAIHISELHLGSGQKPLIHGGDVDIVISLFPLLRDEIIINRLQVINSQIHVIQNNNRWSYDIFKKPEKISESEKASVSENASEEGSFTTMIKEMALENTRLVYNDGSSLAFALEIKEGKMTGSLVNQILDTELHLNCTLSELDMDEYQQKSPVPFVLDGHYVYDMKTGLQKFKEWNIKNEAITLACEGSVLSEAGVQTTDMEMTWKNGDPDKLKKWFPAIWVKSWNQYSISGESEGRLTIDGTSSKNKSPRILCNTTLKNGSIVVPATGENIKGLTVDLQYDSGESSSKQKSTVDIMVHKNSMLGQSLESVIHIRNLSKPVVDVSVKGSLPATLLNFMSISSLQFEQGEFEVDHFEIQDFNPELASFSTFLEQGAASFSASGVKFTYLNNKIELPKGSLKINDGKLSVDLEQIAWNKATATHVKGDFEASDNQLDYTLEGEMCEGKIETKGVLSGMNHLPSCSSLWKVKSIDMKKLMESFDNFDQSFITSTHISGKADIWAESTIPFDSKWNIITQQVLVKSALDIRDGQLKSLKTLEDFGKYIHLEDLRDIRFNQLRNYMKIEAGKVHLPVMFIQSSAINMSISGVHAFDQKILYYIKLNAGQAAATKVKKLDVKKEFKQARKSGWINMYYVLQGNTSDVQYQQYRAAVIAGFEQSTELKESLRNYLVDKFGYDVYWLEPNEWEDIPEYQ